MAWLYFLILLLNFFLLLVIIFLFYQFSQFLSYFLDVYFSMLCFFYGSYFLWFKFGWLVWQYFYFFQWFQFLSMLRSKFIYIFLVWFFPLTDCSLFFSTRGLMKYYIIFRINKWFLLWLLLLCLQFRNCASNYFLLLFWTSVYNLWVF